MEKGISKLVSKKNSIAQVLSIPGKDKMLLVGGP
jgi:hypothetical protein